MNQHAINVSDASPAQEILKSPVATSHRHRHNLLAQGGRCLTQAPAYEGPFAQHRRASSSSEQTPAPRPDVNPSCRRLRTGDRTTGGSAACSLSKTADPGTIEPVPISADAMFRRTKPTCSHYESPSWYISSSHEQKGQNMSLLHSPFRTPAPPSTIS